MIRPSRAGGLSAIVAALVGFGHSAASDDLVVDGRPVTEPAETVQFGPAAGHGVLVLGNRLTQPEYDLAALFDQHLFRRPVGPQRLPMANAVIVSEAAGESPTAGRLAGLRQLARRRIAMLEHVCGLTAQQREILELAAESDLRRLAGDIDARRRSYAGQRLSARAIDRELLQRVRDDAEVCRRRIERFGRSETLLGSVSLELLDSGQRAAFTAWVAGRRAGRWEAMVRTVLGQFDESVLGLSDAQHEALLAGLLADVPPLAVLDDVPAVVWAGRAGDFQAMLVASRLQRLDQAGLRPRFDPRQWAVLEQLGSQHGAAEEIERLLCDQGILEDVP